MIDGIFNLLLGFIADVTTLLLVPIDALISATLPDLNGVFSAISGIFSIATNNIEFIANMTLLSPFAINTICNFIIFKITAKITMFVVKLALSWYRSLK